MVKKDNGDGLSTFTLSSHQAHSWSQVKVDSRGKQPVDYAVEKQFISAVTVLSD